MSRSRFWLIHGSNAAPNVALPDGVQMRAVDKGDLPPIAHGAFLYNGHEGSWERRGQVLQIDIDDLDEALDAINPLIELQGALQDATDGFLVLEWNGALQPPHRDDVADSAVSVWSALMKQAIAPTLKGAGFARSRSTFTRTVGTAEQRIGFRARGNRERRHVHLEVGWNLAEVACLDTDLALVVVGGETVQGDAPVVERQPREWTFTRETLLDDAAELVERELTRVVEALDRLDGPAAVLEHVDLSDGFRMLHRAQLKAVTGDHAGALADVQTLHDAFSRRHGMEVDAILARAGLAFVRNSGDVRGT